MAGDEEKPNDERTFLHDLSNPLSVAYGNIQILLAQVQNGHVESEQVLAKLQKAMKYLDAVVEILEKRRAYVRSLEP